MKVILKDIPKLDNINVVGVQNEPDDHYDYRRTVVESDDYVLSGADIHLTDINDVNNIPETKFTDFLQKRSLLISLITSKGWNSLTNQEKDICIDIQGRDDNFDTATNDLNKVVYLMSLGHTQQEAQMILVDKYSKFHTKEKESCKKRVDSEKLNEVFLTYLTVPDIVDFIKTTEILTLLLSNRAIMGIGYGSVTEGFMNYVESTPGTVYEFSGLSTKGYVLNGGAPIQYLIDGIHDVIINGNY